MKEDGVDYVYVLRDPRTGQIRYLGATYDPARRLQQHRTSPANKAVKAWVKELRSEGLQPQMEVLVTCQDHGAGNVEGFLISRFRRDGYDLMNATYEPFQVPTRPGCYGEDPLSFALADVWHFGALLELEVRLLARPTVVQYPALVRLQAPHIRRAWHRLNAAACALLPLLDLSVAEDNPHAVK